MGDYRKITRSSLYDSKSDYESNNNDTENPVDYMPNIEFEFVEVDKQDYESDEFMHLKQKSLDNIELEEQEKQEDEFEFPLFAASSNTSPNKKLIGVDEVMDDKHSRGRTKDRVMKVSLREASVEVIKNERPISYYFATYNDEVKSQFIVAAVTSDDIYKQIEVVSPVRDPLPWKCIDLEKYNCAIEKELQKNKKKSKSRNRPGKKKRENIIACRERKFERKKVEKEIVKEKEAKIKKKMFHKRGGKRHKKTAGNTESKPKYRTE